MFLFLSLLSLIFRMAAFLRLGCLTFGPTGREGKLSRNETETEIPQCSTFCIVLNFSTRRFDEFFEKFQIKKNHGYF